MANRFNNWRRKKRSEWWIRKQIAKYPGASIMMYMTKDGFISEALPVHPIYIPLDIKPISFRIKFNNETT